VVQTENIILENTRIVILLTILKGIDKPYFDKNGAIWIKCGSDKRRLNSKEELRRLFQISDQFHADELPTKAGIDKLDKLRFRDFLRKEYDLDYPDSPDELIRILQNMNLATDDGMLNLAGVLLFTEHPEWIKPQFIIKAIRYPGNDIHVDSYLDTEDFIGPFNKLFDNGLSFLMRNLHKVQAGQGVNSPGISEIPQVVLEELLVNALIHRDYMVSATIRLFIFDNRIEIISPGHLPNNLTVERIRLGISNIRNPILVSYISKGILPYKGLGSGIKRALELWPEIDFVDDREGCQFTAIIRKKEQLSITERNGKNIFHDNLAVKSGGKKGGVGGNNKRTNTTPGNMAVKKSELTVKNDGKQDGAENKKTDEISAKIIAIIKNNNKITIPALAMKFDVSIRSIERYINKLQTKGYLKRIGPTNGGYWQFIKKNE